jgi:FkbM family methyltransferase
MQVQVLKDRFNVAEEPKDFWTWVGQGRYDTEWGVIHACLRPEHTFLDLGAWIGSHSLYASRTAHRVISLEPDPVAYKILTENIKDVENIRAYPLAIMNHGGEVRMGSGFLGASTTRINREAGGGIGPWEEPHVFTAPCTTLRQLVEDFKIDDPMFIKMDVEGAEEEILKDMKFFEEHKPVLYLEKHPFWWKDVPATYGRIGQISKFVEMAWY